MESGKSPLRSTKKAHDAPELESNLLLELSIQHGAHFEGKRIAELGVPAGCLIITVGRGLHSHVAGLDTVLEAGDRITAVIAPHAAAAVVLLREGVEKASSR